jgi:hypothetical protein
MGIAIPQVITSDRATGAQVIDGSLKFDGSYLKKTWGSAPTSSTSQTFSFWVKLNEISPSANRFPGIFGGQSGTDEAGFSYRSGGGAIKFELNQGNNHVTTTQLFRDTGWYHIVGAYDTSNSTSTERLKLYVNGSLVTALSSSYPNASEGVGLLSNGYADYIGSYINGSNTGDFNLSQFYGIDGQTLDASYFGFTDPLTNTWKPKKYEGTFGTNGFYLPMDGNSPIGQDQSGNGNNWTPVNFGGSVALDSPAVSGARPILNTTQGGTQAGVGVFGSKQNVGYSVTVYNPGGGNKYYLDGVESPTLTGLIRGATYTFDQSDSTNSTHPLVFGTTAEGNNFNKTVTTGVSAGSAGAATTITIPYDGPNTIYYHCSAHSGMGGNITGITTNEKLADQYASHCVLALPLVGSTNDTCASIACTSRNKTATSSGPVGVSTESNFYSGSYYYGAASNTLQYAEQGQELVFNTGDFTIECWLYDDNGHNGGGSGRCYIFDNRIGGSEVGDPPTMTGWVDGHDEFTFYDGDSEITHTVSSTVGKWWHYAVTREGTTTRMFIDGIEVGSSTSSTNFTNNGIGVGRATDSGYGWSGYIQDFRVYRGLAKYTSDFVVPATAPDVLPDTPSGVSGSSKLTKVTNGAVSFDGTNDYLYSGTSTDFTIDGDFTVEAFVYIKDSAINSFFNVGDYIGSSGFVFYSLATSRALGVYTNNALAASGGEVRLNGWNHVALVRSGTTNTLYLDGKSVATFTNSSTFSGDANIGVDYYNSTRTNYTNGFISNLRYIKGTALYTKNFTPPTEPLTNVTNTKLLCCQSNTSAGAAAISPSISGLNNGTVWSDYLTTTQGANSRDFYTVASYPPSNLFDGGTSTIVYGGWTDDADDNSDLIFSPPSGISVSSKLEVYVGYYSKIKVNGADYNTGGESTAQDWVTVSDGSNFTGTLTELILENTTNANVVRAAAIRIDDSTILLDPVAARGDAAATNFNPFITDIHTVRGQETGYATLNHLDTVNSPVLSNGNLDQTESANEYGRARSTLNFDVGDSNGYYAEITATGSVASSTAFGIMPSDIKIDTNATNGVTGFKGLAGRSGPVWWTVDGAVNGTTNTGFSANPGDVLALAVKNGSVDMYINGHYVGAFSGLSGQYSFITGAYGTSNGLSANFGQKPFKYAPPDGFQPLNIANTRPANVISRPDQYVGIITYNGNGGTQNVSFGSTISFDGIPDLVWIKHRTRNQAHVWYDSVRTAGVGKAFNSNDDGEEGAASDGTTYGYLSEFTRNGFTVIDGSDAEDYVNKSGAEYVAWCWKAGGAPTATNTQSSGAMTANSVSVDGVLQSAYTPSGSPTIYPKKMSVGTKQGFSIVQYVGNDTAGATLPHGLTKAPDFFVTKADYDAREWQAYHKSLGNQQPIRLNTNQAAQAAHVSYFNNTSPTASVVTFGNGGDANQGGETPLTYIMYAWHDVPGLQKFGSYIGNQNADGTYIELGFRPKILWIKSSTTVQNWYVHDAERNKFNPTNLDLRINEGREQTTTTRFDFLSNGFKIRGANLDMNDSGETFIYCAWAEVPSVDLFGGGANAR